MSIFSALFGDPQSTDPSAAAPVASANPLASTSPSGPLNYDNSAAIKAVQGTLAANPPQGGSDNPGIFGLLPQNVQHGTLRNILGALGDAFLVQGGRQPAYQEHMQRQEIGNAMAGYDPNDPNSVQAAISRVAATGAPGADTMADQMQKNWNDLQAKKAQMEYMAQFHQQGIDSRNQGIFQRGAPIAMGIASQAKDAADYATKYGLLDQRAKSIDPSMDASAAFGIPTPDQWAPGLFNGYGMTSNNQQVASDKAAQRTVSERDTDVRAGATIGAANIGADSRIDSAHISADKPTASGFVQYLTDKQNRGEQLTPAEQKVWDKETSIRGKGRSLPAGLVVGGSGNTSGGISVQNYGANNPVANGGQPLSAAQAASLPKGTHFLGHDGKWYVR